MLESLFLVDLGCMEDILILLVFGGEVETNLDWGELVSDDAE